jgi:hypothetical protein
MSLMRRTIFVCAVASLGVIAWKNLNEEQRVSLTDAVNSGRRKLANFIAPQEDLGDLTDRFDPGFLEALISDEIKYQDSVHQPEAPDCDPGDRIDPEP